MAQKYCVRDNDMPAGTAGSAFKWSKGKGFDQWRFDRMQDAVEYAIKYLSPFPEQGHEKDYAVGLRNNPLAVVMLMEGYKYTEANDVIRITLENDTNPRD
jgi:hypothetical protein